MDRPRLQANHNFCVTYLQRYKAQKYFDCINSHKPRLVAQPPQMSIFIRKLDQSLLQYLIPWIFLNLEKDNYLRDIEDREESGFQEFAYEDEDDVLMTRPILDT